MKELVEVVNKLKPDGFEPKIIKQTDDYLYAEYQSPTFGVSTVSNNNRRTTTLCASMC